MYRFLKFQILHVSQILWRWTPGNYENLLDESSKITDMNFISIKNTTWEFGKSYKLLYFQVRESTAPLHFSDTYILIFSLIFWGNFQEFVKTELAFFSILDWHYSPKPGRRLFWNCWLIRWSKFMPLRFLYVYDVRFLFLENKWLSISKNIH